MRSKNEDLVIPEKVASYKIEGLLTKGGMSLLYLGTHPKTEKPILIKVLLPKYIKDSEIVDRFLNEAKVIEKTKHQNIVKLYESGSWEGGLFIAMEFVKGTSLRKVLDGPPLSLKRALDLLLQIASALCHLHTHGIVHGDLKPENILIDESGQVKLIDFGIARILTDEDSTKSKRLVGTPIYMSPEQLADWGEVSCQSDIYSLGIIAYELALSKITHGKVIISLAPKGLQKILHKALQPDPKNRYLDIADFIADLSFYIKNETYKEDTQGSEYFVELYEKLEAFQKSLESEKVPDYAEISYHKNSNLSGTFYHFYSRENGTKGLFVAEPTDKDIQGLLALSALKSLFSYFIEIHQSTPTKEFFEELSCVINRNISTTFSFCLFEIDEEQETISFHQKDFGTIIVKENERITLHDTLEKMSYEKKSSFLLFGAQSIGSAEKKELNELILKATNEKISFKKLLDQINQKIELSKTSTFFEKPALLALITF